MDITTCLKNSLTKSPYQGSSIYVNISVVWRWHGLPTSDGGGGGAGVERRGVTASNGGGTVTCDASTNVAPNV